MHACMDIYNTYIYNVYNVSPISRQPSWVLVPTPDIRPATANTFSRLGKEAFNTMVDLTNLTNKHGDLVGGFNHLEKYESQWEG